MCNVTHIYYVFFLIRGGLINYSRGHVTYWDSFFGVYNFDYIIFKLGSGLRYYPGIQNNFRILLQATLYLADAGCVNLTCPYLQRCSFYLLFQSQKVYTEQKINEHIRGKTPNIPIDIPRQHTEYVKFDVSTHRLFHTKI